MKQLLDYIQKSGELDKYWSIVEKQNEEARKAARRLEKERRKLEMGSDYETSSEEGGAAGQDDYYSDEYSESEEASQPDDEAEEESTSRLGMTEEMSDLGRQSKNGNFPEEKQ